MTVRGTTTNGCRGAPAPRCARGSSPAIAPHEAGAGGPRRLRGRGVAGLVAGAAAAAALLAAATIAAALLASGTAASGGGPGAVGWRLHEPWPSPAEVADIRGEAVTFASSSPFVPADAADAEPATAIGRLYLPRPGPDGARPPPRSVPAVVLLHGAGGVLSAREPTYARQLAAMGAAALVLDVFGARAEWASGGFSDRLVRITETMALADAYAALRALPLRWPEIDPHRVALVGFSYGAMAAVYGAFAMVAERLAPGGERFAAHAAFYGPCIARFEDVRTTGAPVLMLYGGADELIVPARCAELAEDLRRGGSPVRVATYPGAVHQWDGGTSLRRIGMLLGDCRLRVGADGRVRDRRTGMPMSGPFLRRLILAACVENRPYLIGADAAVRARSNAELGRFLHAAFAGTGRADGGSRPAMGPPGARGR